MLQQAKVEVRKKSVLAVYPAVGDLSLSPGVSEQVPVARCHPITLEMLR